MSGTEALSAALERTTTRFARMLRSVGRGRGLDDADLDELVQDVRIRLWRALDDAEKIERVNASYVYRAAMSAALDMVRRARARPEERLRPGRAIVGAVPTGSASAEAHLERRDLAERIEGALAELPGQREVVVRLYLSGYDRFEIAALLDWSEPKVRNLLYRGLADLRARLSREGIGWQRVT